eukprot:2034419-Karenia_brevis.AAC.1
MAAIDPYWQNTESDSHAAATGRIPLPSELTAIKKRPAQCFPSREEDSAPGPNVDEVEVVAVTLGGEPDEVVMEAAYAVVLNHALLVQDSLHEVSIPGDGSCQYRSCALQMYGGEAGHEDLRAAATEEVSAHRDFYQNFL